MPSIDVNKNKGRIHVGVNLGKKVYLSGPYSGIESVAPKMFENAKKYLLENTSCEEVWVPTEQIPPTYNWEESMEVCRKVLDEDKISCMVVIVNAATLSSKGVAEEIRIASDRDINICLMLAFGSDRDGKSTYTFVPLQTATPLKRNILG